MYKGIAVQHRINKSYFHASLHETWNSSVPCHSVSTTFEWIVWIRVHFIGRSSECRRLLFFTALHLQVLRSHGFDSRLEHRALWLMCMSHVLTSDGPSSTETSEWVQCLWQTTVHFGSRGLWESALCLQCVNLCGREYGIAGHSDIHSESFRHSDRNSESKPILKVFFNFPCFSLIFVEFQHFRMWCHVVVWALRKVAGDDGSKGWEPRDFVVEMSTHLSQGQRVIGAASQGHKKKR